VTSVAGGQQLKASRIGKGFEMTTLAPPPGVPQSAVVEAAARSCLLKKGFHSLKRVRCRFHQGTLFLRGRVARFYHKQLAQESVRLLKSVRGIVNEIEVSPSRTGFSPVQIE
jgi:hypothetical protein